MFADFATTLILFVFCFRVLIMVAVIPFALIYGYLNRNKEESESDKWPAIINQTLVGLLFAGMVALLCRFAADSPTVEHRWLYWITGFIVVMFVLGSNAADKSKIAEEEPWSPSGDGARVGASIGLFLALLYFPIVFVMPALMTVIPGAAGFYEIVARFAIWLNSFWIVQAILYFVMGSYILNLGFVAIMMIGVAGYAAWNGIFNRSAEKSKGKAAGA